MGKATVGTPINVGEVISRSTNLLKANPSIILIQLIPAVPSLLSDVFSGPTLFDPVALLMGVLTAVLSVIASGAYAPVVKGALTGQRLTLEAALGHAYRKFWSLLGAGILVVLIVFVGAIALVVPGIIFATWYAYTTPAIVLEDRGALEGMSASRSFGRDKKLSTFLIFLTFFLVYILVAAVGAALSLGGGGRLIQTLLDVPLSAWTSVVIAYTYITCGPSATSTQPPGQPVATMPRPAPITEAPVGVCSSCGAPLPQGSKFCGNCGKPV